jgi:hypothetical protein
MQSCHEAKFLPPEVRMVTHQEEKEHRRAMLHLCAHRSDEVNMMRFRAWLLQEEYEFCDASPTMVKVESPDSDGVNWHELFFSDDDDDDDSGGGGDDDDDDNDTDDD